MTDVTSSNGRQQSASRMASQISRHKFSAVTVCAVFFVISGLMFIVPRASAASAAYAWTAANTISTNGFDTGWTAAKKTAFTFKCEGSGTKYECQAVDVGVCKPKVDIKGDVTKGTLTHYKSDLEIGCAKDGEEDIAIQGTPSAPVAAPTDPNVDGTKDHDSNPTCQTGGFGLNWILCPVFNTVADASDFLFRQIVEPLLRTSPISTNADNCQNGKGDCSYQIWSNFRVYGNIFLVFALIFIVFGQSIGGGLVDAYTAKKALPRILVGVILINLSIYIVAGLVDITNIVGGAIGQLITAPLADAGAFHISPSFVQAGTIVGISGGGIGAGLLALTAPPAAGAAAAGAAATGAFIGSSVGMFLLVFIILPVFFGLLSAFITLALRQAIILALILVSPVAFALYCLPNTEKYFRKWWEALFKTLLVYPIVIVIFAVADVISVTVYNANDGTAASPLATVMSFLFQFLPLLLIPYAFKLAGGLIGQAHGLLTNYNKRGMEAIKGNPNDANSLRNRTKRKTAENLTRGLNRSMQAGDDVNATRVKRLRGRLAGSGAFGDVNQRMSTYNKLAAERKDAKMSTGDDTEIYAGAGYEEGGKFYNGRGAEIGENLYRRGKRLHGATGSDVGSSLEYVLRKASSQEQVAAFRKSFAKNAIANNWSDGETKGAWATATYPHKDKWRSEWFSTPAAVKGRDGKTEGVLFDDVDVSNESYDKMIKEFHSVPENFRVSSTRAQDWHAMSAQMEKIQPKITAGTATAPELERYTRTSELLDTMTHQGMVTYDNDGEATVTGANAETQNVISAMYKSRRYATTPLQTAPGQYSTTERAIYDDRAVKAATARVGGGAPAMSKEAAVRANTIGSAKVSDDRSTTPRISF